MPLVQVAKDKRDWLKTALVFMVGMVVVTALFGAIVGGAGGAFAGLAASARPMALVMKPVLIGMGLLMILVALGEFRLVPRLLPELHPAQRLAEVSAEPVRGGPYCVCGGGGECPLRGSGPRGLRHRTGDSNRARRLRAAAGWAFDASAGLV